MLCIFFCLLGIFSGTECDGQTLQRDNAWVPPGVKKHAPALCVSGVKKRAPALCDSRTFHCDGEDTAPIEDGTSEARQTPASSRMVTLPIAGGELHS